MFYKKGNKSRKIDCIEKVILYSNDLDELSNFEKRLIIHEDFILKPYKCPAGILTVGAGHTGGVENRIYTIEECVLLLRKDIAIATDDFLDIFYGYDINIYRKEALIDMLFNLGKTRFMRFKKMIKAIKENNWDVASEEAKDSKWYNQVGYRAKAIVLELKEGEDIV